MKITRLGSFALGFGLALAVSDGVRWWATPPEPEAITVTSFPTEVCLTNAAITEGFVITYHQPLFQPVHNCSPAKGQPLHLHTL